MVINDFGGLKMNELKVSLYSRIQLEFVRVVCTIGTCG